LGQKGLELKKNDRYTSLVWAGFGIYIAFEGCQLKLGTFHNPGCGFLVFGAGAILSILSTVLFIQTFFSKNGEGIKILWKGVQWFKGIKLMASLFIYVLVLKWMGFLMSTFLLLFFLFQGLESQKWRVSLLLSVISTAVCYLIFSTFLEFRFPEGILEKVFGQLSQ
jgi:hypothetical protein